MKKRQKKKIARKLGVIGLDGDFSKTIKTVNKLLLRIPEDKRELMQLKGNVLEYWAAKIEDAYLGKALVLDEMGEPEAANEIRDAYEEIAATEA